MSVKKTISVFIASPGDLAEERAKFKESIEELNNGFGIGADVEFDPLGWEDTLALAGRRNQSLINHEIDRCDVFILCLHRRWGQDAPDSAYSSYTEEEFHRALERFKESGKPEIFTFFKRTDPGQEADPGPQLEKVMGFRRQLEESRQVMYHYFDNNEGFREKVSRHLIAFAKGEIPQVQKEAVNILPLSAIEEIETAKKQAEQALKDAEEARQQADQAYLRAEVFQLEFAEEAAVAANKGKLETARQKFAKAVDGTTNIKVLNLAYTFYRRTGELNLAETYLNRSLAISGKDSQSSQTAAAYGNLGNIYQIRGELEKAEEFYLKSLEINESLGRKEGMANQYGNLGIIYKIRGELEKAEEFLLKSLEIDESLGRKEGMAITYGNLGIIYQTRGELEKAEEFFLKSLEINDSLGRNEGLAIVYGNLGNIYKTRGELETAEGFHLKSLEINESLGRKQGMAIAYGNLGNIYETRGELEKAERFHLKSLEIDESLGRKEGMASTYGNLGNICQIRGELEKAVELWKKSLSLFTEVGAVSMIAQIQGWIDSLKGSNTR
ncbi:MAG: tetratricopeptide (TPR) repeat protein [Arenicella sp.]